MKRWDYNTLKGEVWLFTVFLFIMLFEIAGAFYILFFADFVCFLVCDNIGSPQSATLLTWATRFVVVVYMYLAAWLFFWLVKKQGSI